MNAGAQSTGRRDRPLGTFDLERDSPAVLLLYALALLGSITASAIWPGHWWLP